MDITNNPITDFHNKVQRNGRRACSTINSTLGDHENAEVVVTSFHEDQKRAMIKAYVDLNEVNGRYLCVTLGERMRRIGYRQQGKDSNGRVVFVKRLSGDDK